MLVAAMKVMVIFFVITGLLMNIICAVDQSSGENVVNEILDVTSRKALLLYCTAQCLELDIGGSKTKAQRQWSESPCVLCQYGPYQLGNMTGGNLKLLNSGCLMYTNKKMSHSAAKSYCASFGFKLIALDSRKKYDEIIEFIQKISEIDYKSWSQFWTSGQYSEEAQFPFYWSTTDRFLDSYTDWFHAEHKFVPYTFRCLSSKSDYKNNNTKAGLLSTVCSNKLSVICEWQTKPSPTYLCLNILGKKYILSFTAFKRSNKDFGAEFCKKKKAKLVHFNSMEFVFHLLGNLITNEELNNFILPGHARVISVEPNFNYIRSEDPALKNEEYKSYASLFEDGNLYYGSNPPADCMYVAINRNNNSTLHVFLRKTCAVFSLVVCEY